MPKKPDTISPYRRLISVAMRIVRGGKIEQWGGQEAFSKAGRKTLIHISDNQPGHYGDIVYSAGDLGSGLNIRVFNPVFNPDGMRELDLPRASWAANALTLPQEPKFTPAEIAALARRLEKSKQLSEKAYSRELDWVLDVAPKPRR